MYCMNCGKEIPDRSVYCMFCGQNQKETSHSVEKHTENTSPPVMIARVGVWADGPTDFRKGSFLSHDEYGRWVAFSVALKDANLNYTTCDGEMMLGIVKSSSAFLAGTRTVEEVKKKAFYFGHFEVTQRDFRWRSCSNIHGSWKELNFQAVDNKQVAYHHEAHGYPGSYRPFAYAFFLFEDEILSSKTPIHVDWGPG